LRETLERQTATTEVLEVINSSPGELGPVFGAMLDRALRLCEAAFGVFWTYDDEFFRAVALMGVPKAFADFAQSGPHRVGRGNAFEGVLSGEPFIHVEDGADSDAYRAGDPLRRGLVDLAGAKTLLAIPLLRDDALVGMLMLCRREMRSFSERH